MLYNLRNMGSSVDDSAFSEVLIPIKKQKTIFFLRERGATN